MTATVLEANQEAINHPGHYGGDTVYEVIKVIHAWGLDRDFNLGNCVKYIARAGKKDPAKEIEDLEKAKFYLEYAIKIRLNTRLIGANPAHQSPTVPKVHPALTEAPRAAHA